MKSKRLLFTFVLGIFLSPGLLFAQSRKPALFIGANYYTDSVQGVIGDISSAIGHVSGINLNASYRDFFYKSLFYRAGLGLDIGQPQSVEDTQADLEYSYSHSRIEIPVLVGFTHSSGLYAALGFQFIQYKATLETEIKGEDDTTPVSNDYTLSGFGSSYFLYGAQSSLGRNQIIFFEVQYSQASGVGERKNSEQTNQVQIAPVYVRWNAGIQYYF